MKHGKLTPCIRVLPQLLLPVLVWCAGFAQAPASQTASRQDSLIAASQAGAMPVFFDPSDSGTPTISAGKFRSNSECRVRGGLPNFFYKVNTKQAVTIGYIGGSITRGENMYRNQSAKFIQSMFPGVKVKAINAGVSGTGTDLGACRIREQLLKYHPDLIFIEFAVNGAFREGMEGMIRPIIQFDSSTDICLLYAVREGQTAIYQQGRVPDNIEGLESIAAYYQLPSIHMGMEAAMLEKSKKLVWRGAPGRTGNQIVFSEDGVHPLKAGGSLYASAIARAMIKMKSKGHGFRHVLPPPLLEDSWADATMLDPGKNAVFTGQWRRLNPDTLPLLKSFAPWFPYIMHSCTPGASFTFRFKGNMVGLFDIGGPESGQLTVTVDGADVKLLNRFNYYCNNRYRGQCEFIMLHQGWHTVRFTVSAVKADKKKILGAGRQKDITDHPEKYNRTCELLGKILIRGAVVQKN